MANAKKAAEPDFQNKEFVVEANPVTTKATPSPEVITAAGDEAPEGTDEAKEARWRGELEGELSNEATVTAVIEFLKAEGYDLNDVIVTEGIWGWAESSDCATIDIGNKDYMIFPDVDTAESFARALVMNDLENEPEIFDKSWLDRHVDEDKLRDILSSDVENDIRENPGSYGYEGRWRVTLTGPNGERELVPGDFLDEGDADDAGQDAIDEKNANLEEGEEEWQYNSEEIPADEDDNIDSWASDKAEELLKDPVEYLNDIYGEKGAANYISEWGCLDLDAAADDAIATDGWQHFVASYDGNSHDLPGGGVWVRHN
jgi:hypothetical protein